MQNQPTVVNDPSGLQQRPPLPKPNLPEDLPLPPGQMAYQHLLEAYRTNPNLIKKSVKRWITQVLDNAHTAGSFPRIQGHKNSQEAFREVHELITYDFPWWAAGKIAEVGIEIAATKGAGVIGTKVVKVAFPLILKLANKGGKAVFRLIKSRTNGKTYLVRKLWDGNKYVPGRVTREEANRLVNRYNTTIGGICFQAGTQIWVPGGDPVNGGEEMAGALLLPPTAQMEHPLPRN